MKTVRAHIWVDSGATIRAYSGMIGDERIVTLRIGDVLLHMPVQEAEHAEAALQSVTALVRESATAATVAR